MHEVGINGRIFGRIDIKMSPVN